MKHGFMFCLLMALALPISAWQEADPEVKGPEEIPAFREGLVAVPLPDLNKAEKAVAQQISRFQNSLNTLIKSAPNADMELSNAYGMLGNVYYAYKIRLSAEACFTNAHILAPDRFSWVYLRGTLNQAQGDLEAAERDYKLASKLKESYPPLWVNLGDLVYQNNQLDEARGYYQKALEINPKSAAAYFGLGQVELSAKDYAAAAENLEAALKLSPESNRIHYSLGQAYRKLGDKSKARSHLALNGKVGVKEADPLLDDLNRLLRGERVHMQRGKAAFNARRYEDALAEYRRAVNSAPDSVRARVNLAVTLSFLNKVDEAVTHFEEALKLDPQNLTAHYNLGYLYGRLDQLEKAENHLLKVIEANVEDTDARLVLAGVWRRMDKTKEALELYGRLTEVRGLDEDGTLGYASLLIGQGDFKAAGQILSQGQAAMPNSGLITRALAKFLAACPDTALRDGTRALELAKLIVKVQPSAEHLEIMAMAYAQVGDCQAAAQFQEQAYEAARQANADNELERLGAVLEYYRNTSPCNPK